MNSMSRRNANAGCKIRFTRDYHNWDAKEDEAYRHWLETKHEAYLEYEKLDRKRQEEYWKWQHEHQ